MIFTIKRSSLFDEWLFNLLDEEVKARILTRIKNAALGNFGDCKNVGDGVWEMRVHINPGFRIYYTRIGSVTYFLLCGGTKSTQKKDIAQAKKMADMLKDS